MDAKTFNQELKETLTKLKSERLAKDRHPSSETLLAFAEQTLDAETTRHVRMHTLFCQTCRNDLYGLRAAIAEEQTASEQAAQSEQQKSAARAWRDFVEQLKKFVLDLGRTYGPGAMLGSIRIIAESPALAVRGESTSEKKTLKVLELPIGPNTYSLEVAVAPDGALSFDIAGSHAPREVPLTIAFQSESGEEIFQGATDKYGNLHFVTARGEASGGHYVLSLFLDDAEEHLARVVPDVPS